MANVRIFGYKAMVQIKQSLVKQFTGAGVFVRQEPYLWAQTLALNGLTPVETTVNAAAVDDCDFIVVEVDDDTAVRYELNPGGPTGTGHRNASAGSPKGVGEFPMQWFKGATISFIDAAGT